MDSKLVVTCARGTERALRFEIEQLQRDQAGAPSARGTGHGAVTLEATPEIAARVLVESRIAHRVLMPLVQTTAHSEAELAEVLSQVRFEELGSTTDSFAVEAHLTSAPLTHSLYAAQRVKDCVVDRFRAVGLGRPSVDRDSPSLRYVLRWERAELSLGLDLGGLLSHRGYRDPRAEAPMRETLAAAILALAHADVRRPFLDPCCGGGTLAIEQALRALQIAPRQERRFPCEAWKKPTSFVSQLVLALPDVRARARAARREALPAPISLSDYHQDAVDSARVQLRAAGLEALLRVSRRDARQLEAPAGPGGEAPVIVANLPFGERVSSRNILQLEGFYRSLGRRLRELPAARVILFTALPGAEELLALGEPRRWQLMSGALKGSLLRYDW